MDISYLCGFGETRIPSEVKESKHGISSFQNMNEKNKNRETSGRPGQSGRSSESEGEHSRKKRTSKCLNMSILGPGEDFGFFQRIMWRPRTLVNRRRL